MELKCTKLEEQVRELESEKKSLCCKLNQKASIRNSTGSSSMCGMNHDQISQLLDQVVSYETSSILYKISSKLFKFSQSLFLGPP